MNQTLMDMTRCLLIESGLSKQFWADAMNTACYLRNRSPSKAIENKIPEELWSGKPVKLDHLRTFGCKVWTVRSKLDKRSKLDPKGEATVLIGYPDGVKGYKLWNFVTDKILVSRDVKFEEHVYPMKKEVPTVAHQHEDDEIMFGDETIEDERNKEETTQHENKPAESKEEIPAETQLKKSTPAEDILVHAVPRNMTTENLDTESNQKKRKRKNHSSNEDPPRRSERIAAQEKKCYSANQITNAEPDPLTVKQAMTGEEAKEWKEAMKVEISHMKDNKTWDLVPRPENRTVIGSKWVFKKKYTNDCNLERYKARLVAKGFSQIPGVDYIDTYSPVMKMKSLRILLALAVKWNWHIKQLDVTTAYLNGTLQEEIYMEQPEMFPEKGKENCVCKLNKTIYGLKQAGREWNNCFDNFLQQTDLTRSKADPCIYYNLEEGILLGVYVDDTVMIVKDEETGDRFIQKIQEAFETRNLGEVDHVLSIRIKRKEDGSISIDQTKYAEEILTTFGMSESRGLATPLDPGAKLSKVPDDEWKIEESKSKQIPYRQAVGSILYLAGITRPDIAYAATYLSQFNERPTEEHWKSVKHVLRYIKKTKNYKLTFRKGEDGISAYSDSDWARDKIDRKSFSGYVFSLGGTAVSWRCRKQKTTALSTVEAEYLAMCETTKEALWLRALLTELGEGKLFEEPLQINVDNQGAMCLAKNQITSDRSKHIDLRYFFLREMVDEGKVAFKYVPSERNLADMLTKPLGALHVKGHSEQLGLQPQESVDHETVKGKC